MRQSASFSRTISIYPSAMRLTLRTLLAYLDGILEKGDAEELSAKIHESEFATNQVHRIRDVTKRIRLAAPKLLGQGAGLDPNTVADYLDNTLPPERAPDFEKVCLESDVHLAEVAACHHILTMVLGEPAEVEAATRQRMYHLVGPGSLAGQTIPPPPAPIDKARGDVAAPGSPPPLATVEPVAAVRRDLQVPDYLRQSTGQRIRPWLALAALLLAGAAAVFMFGGEELRKKLGLAANAPPPSDPPQQVEAPKPPVDRVSPAQPIADKVAINSDSVKPATPSGDSAPPPERKAVEKSEAVQPSSIEKTESPSPEPKPREETPAAQEKLVPTAPPNPPPPNPGRNEPPPVKTPLPAGAMIGQYAAPDDVLLRYDAKGETWVRLSPGTPLALGDRLLALPGFRPPILFNTGVALQLDGGTIIQLISGDDGAPGVHVEYGRLLRWGTSGKTGVTCRARVGEHLGTIRFSDPDSAIAVEVYRYYEPGEDPISAPGPIVADVAVIGGQIEWLADGEPQATVVLAGTGRTWVGKTLATSKPLLKIPGWIDPLQPSEIDQRAMDDIKKKLVPGEPIGLAITELMAEVRRSETRSLAARGVGFLGKYDALLAGLKDESLAWAQWRVKYVGALRSAILRGPEEATLVRDALISKFGAKMGADLYRMLCGYNPRQLTTGADEGLVELLSHDELPYRVLAFYNLQAITQVSHGYRPEGTEIQRRTPTQTWRAWQTTGRIAYKDRTPAKNGGAAGDAPPSKTE
jgi:hypothetical protein